MEVLEVVVLILTVVAAVTVGLSIAALVDGAIGAGCGMLFLGAILALVTGLVNHSTSQWAVASKFINRECATTFTYQEVREFPEAVLRSIKQNPCKETVEHILTKERVK
jgi:hypothetical protein